MSTATATPDDDERAALRLPLADGPCILVIISDTGTGMTPDVQSRLFEPYVTTKGAKGTGLGLVQVREALRDCGGSLSIRSQPGHGTTFNIWLPLAAAPAAPAALATATA
jgi:signal transduction histidine kinase